MPKIVEVNVRVSKYRLQQRRLNVDAIIWVESVNPYDSDYSIASIKLITGDELIVDMPYWDVLKLIGWDGNETKEETKKWPTSSRPIRI